MPFLSSNEITNAGFGEVGEVADGLTLAVCWLTSMKWGADATAEAGVFRFLNSDTHFVNVDWPSPWAFENTFIVRPLDK